MAEFLVIEGIVQEIIFQNIANGYTVCDIDVEGVFSTAVGIMPGIAPGEGVRLTGRWTTHAEYGEQFRVETCEKILPTGEMQILQYLSSGIIKGVGPATAQKIVDKFGKEALEVIRDDPDRLATIKGISRKKAEEMQISLMEKQAVQNVVMFLQPYGVTPNFAVRVFRKFGPSTVTLIEQNPYALCEVEGIGFKTADKIAMQMGADITGESRLKNGVKYVLTEYSAGGHTYLPEELLVRSSAEILGVDEALVQNVITGMLLEGVLIQEAGDTGRNLYLPAFFHAEMGVARRLYTIMHTGQTGLGIPMEAAVHTAERRAGITLSEEQRNACFMVMQNGASVITGGPGTGKTTVINAIIEIMTAADASVTLCAPTGRAAKRMAETCGMEAKTIHRLLELNFSGDGERQTFGRNEENPLDEDVIIVDEMSMVDVLLMYALLRAMKPGARLIMVGDADQLTSVGAGDVLRDILQSGTVPVCRLTDIYRQAAESMIVVGAHKINAGEAPEVNRKDKDFFLMHREDAEGILQTICDVCAVRLPRAYGLDPLKQIQVISPSRKSALGINVLNKALQARLNPPAPGKQEKPMQDWCFREGDKVMQVRNNYDIAWRNPDSEEGGNGVFNGDVGRIYSINQKGRYLEVLFDEERLVRYDFTELEDLEMAYAVTVHKSQGSEFDAVVIPMFPCAPQLMCRNLLYTAVTRAKKLVILVGRESVMHTMIANNRQIERYSGLAGKIRGMIR
ncbi:MAG: ATP-dependent RecD-like DNA helicase [Ruminococcaceae bacterium]|nr:ATP-dependent RecD-like DNA helicase [Oscillospiraceae bacterium]